MKTWEQFLKVDDWTSQYKSVDIFLKHYSRKIRSEKTRENVGYILKGLCVFAQKTPDELVLSPCKDASGLVQGYIDSLADKGFSTRYVNVSLGYLKTFFRVNGFKGPSDLEVERHYQPSRYRKKSEYIPSSAEIYDIAFSSGTRRNRAIMLSLYTSGLRNSTLRALLYGDVREELASQKEIIKVPVYPEMKRIDDGACKGNIPYFSFISKEAVIALKQYLEQRIEQEGKMEDDEPLFASESSNVAFERRSHIPVMKKTLEATVKIAAQKIGVKRWKDVYPHCLRKAFESALRNARLDPKDQEFLMGHILPGTQDVYYDKTKVEELRQKYSSVNFFPEKNGLSEDSRKRQIIDMAKVFGFSEDKIKKMEDVLAKHRNVDESIQELSRLKEDTDENKDERRDKTTTVNHDKKQKYVVVKGNDDMIRRLNDGWNLVQTLSDETYLFKF